MAEQPPKKKSGEMYAVGPDGTKEDAAIWEALLGKDDTPPRDQYFHDLSQPTRTKKR